MDYVYLGDRYTAERLRKQPCDAVKRAGKCIRGKNGLMLVVFADGIQRIVIARLLRKIKS